MFNKMKYIALSGLLFVALGICFEQKAQAYVDPGSSLLVFQSFGAIVSGSVFYFRKRIKSLFMNDTSAQK